MSPQQEESFLSNKVGWMKSVGFINFSQIYSKFPAPVHRGKSAKFTRNIFTRMENAKGPLALLKKFKDEKIRVKIYLRKEHGVRGFVTGFIETFDKHLNIALCDCIEQWKRRKHKFSENKVALLGEPKDCSDLLARMGIEVPKITAKSINRKYVECTRKIPQLMVRGEEVVLVGEDKKESEGCRGYSNIASKCE